MKRAISGSPLGSWGSDAAAAAKVALAPYADGKGNLSNVKGAGAGVYECKIGFGPVYRIYFGKDGERIAILIGGSTKKRQEIKAAQQCWADYKRRKKLENI